MTAYSLFTEYNIHAHVGLLVMVLAMVYGYQVYIPPMYFVLMLYGPYSTCTSHTPTRTSTRFVSHATYGATTAVVGCIAAAVSVGE